MPKITLDSAQLALAEAVTSTLREADAAVLAAIRAAANGGVSANEIARRASDADVPGYSRMLILRIVSAEDLHVRTEVALADAGWAEGDVRVWRDRQRRVRVTLPGNAYNNHVARLNGASALGHTLREAGLRLTSDEPGDAYALLADGEPCYVMAIERA